LNIKRKKAFLTLKMFNNKKINYNKHKFGKKFFCKLIGRMSNTKHGNTKPLKKQDEIPKCD